MRKFGERLKELREERGLTQVQLSKLTGISNTSISRWEHGQADVFGDWLIILSKFFGVSADYLLGLED